MLGKEWPGSSAGAFMLFCVSRNNCPKRKCRATVFAQERSLGIALNYSGLN